MHGLRRFAIMISILLTLSLAAVAQESLPEAPRPRPGAKPSLPVNGAPPPPPNVTMPGPGESSSATTSAEGAAAAEQGTRPPSAPPVGQVVPSNRTANAPSSGYDQINDVIRVNTNEVVVPVTVKDANGHLFPGLTVDNFSVYENGVKQRITFFTSDPFPVSAALIVDIGLPETELRRFKQTFEALVGAFSQFDELSIYSYGSTVRQRQDFVAALGDTTGRTLSELKEIGGLPSGPAVYNPMTVGPTVNGRVFDPGTQRNPVDLAPPRTARPSSVLNDAILQAALDLGRRGRARRKVIFVLSDGRESGSTARYKDVLRVLLTNGVSVYGVETGAAVMPGYRRLEDIHLPGQGYGNILPRYASATGGEIFSEFSRQALDAAYGTAMEEARSQYTLAYQTEATASTAYRNVEIRVSGYGTSLRVYARKGYYPVPQKP